MYNMCVFASHKMKRLNDTLSVLKNMHTIEFIIWGVVLIPMIVMSLFLINGKGAFLIAGYNTMPKKERAKYDEKALCRFTGKFLLAMTFVFLLVPIGIHTEKMWLSLCVIPMSVFATVGLLIYANTGNRFHRKGNVEELAAEENKVEKEKREKSDRRASTIALCIVSVVMVGVMCAISHSLITGEKDPTVKVIDNSIQISGMYGVNIDFSEITGISLMANTISSIGLTMRTNGYGTPSTQKGYFRSNKHGKVLLFTKTKSSPTIHIKRKSKEDVFLNFSDNEVTRTLYNELKTAFIP